MKPDIRTKLAAHGVELPERPTCIGLRQWPHESIEDYDARSAWIAALESALSRVADELDRQLRAFEDVREALREDGPYQEQVAAIHAICERAKDAGKRGEGAGNG